MEGWYPIAIGLEAVASGFSVSLFSEKKRERATRLSIKLQRTTKKERGCLVL